MKKLIQLTLFCALIFPTFLLGKDTEITNPRLQEYFEILAHETTDFSTDGVVCERVAMREVESLYPAANFEIVNSISYDEHNVTVGELDLVIFDKSTKKVSAIAEVKCWKSFSGALKKAKNQRMRFVTHLNNNIEIHDQDGKRYSKDLFKNVQKYFTISQAGGLNQGFDFELSLDLKELMSLRSMLLDCKAQGRCPIR
jgi:hypothetical protein